MSKSQRHEENGVESGDNQMGNSGVNIRPHTYDNMSYDQGRTGNSRSNLQLPSERSLGTVDSGYISDRDASLLQNIYDKLWEHQQDFARLGVIFFRKDNEMQKIFLDVKEGHQPSRVKDKLETCLTSEDILNVHVAKAEFDFVFESYSYGIGSSIFCRGFQTCGTAGTIGGFVKVVTDSDSTVEQFAVMTCSHTIVCKDCKNRGVPLDKGLVFVKDNYDGTLLIGSTSVHVPECDAAIAFLNDNQREQMCSNNLLAFLTTNGTHNLINNHIYLETLCKNIQVQKLGAGTKHTSGTVVHTDVRVSDENGTGIKDVFAVVGHAESFSENGDSGAFVTSVIAEHSDIVIIYGMVIGGSPSQSDSPKLTFAVRMDKIFEQFKNLHCQLDLISLEEYIMMNSMNLHAPCPSETNNECN